MYCWISDGSGTFDIAEIKDDSEQFERGTKIVIHLKPEYLHYLDE
jgi:HSP90 family molecular chaperone